VYIKLKSGWNIVISKSASAVVGVVSNKKHITVPYGKAGVIRNLGFRPVVRGVAMNPIDHPHGGGQGRTSGGPQPLSPWGKLTKWRPTVSELCDVVKVCTVFDSLYLWKSKYI
jgi:large subunit ribosomal protein L2